MTVWVFIATIAFAGTTIQMFPDNQKYAFATKALCEYAIAESPMLKCVPLTLMTGKD